MRFTRRCGGSARPRVDVHVLFGTRTCTLVRAPSCECISGAQGHGLPLVALVQSVVANGGSANGVRLLSPETIKVIFDEQANGIDLVLGIPLRFGIGYGLPETTTLPYLPNDPGICFWGGYGGSMIIVDTTRKMTLAYMMNRMSPGIIGSATSGALIAAAYGCVS